MRPHTRRLHVHTPHRRRARGAALLATADHRGWPRWPPAAPTTTRGDGGGGGDAKKITVWIEEDLPDRVAATQAIVDAFTAETGIEVELTPVAEDQFNQILTSNAAAGDLPDVMGGIPLGQIRTLSANELIDTDAVADVIDELGRRHLQRERARADLGRRHRAWPSRASRGCSCSSTARTSSTRPGWPPPRRTTTCSAAAEALDSADVAGFVGANVAGDAFTEQTFEEIGLGNGCELVDDDGEVTFDSDECVEAMDFYGQLQPDYSVDRRPGRRHHAGVVLRRPGRDADLVELHPRRDGGAARTTRAPTCPECADDPAYLAKNSGVVTSIQGPSGDEPATFGEITSWTIPAEASTDPAKQFVEYMMTDGYEPWIAIAPEGKIPVRAGASADSTEYADAWAGMDVGVDTKAPLSEFYGPGGHRRAHLRHRHR